MREEIVNLVHPLISYALQLRDQLRHGVRLNLHVEQAVLKGKLQTEVESRRLVDYGGEARFDASVTAWGYPAATERSRGDAFLGVRYALACWLDELFLTCTPWSREWENLKLETQLYGTNDRSWNFWEQATRAEGRPGGDALEVFYLCVVLGFRGDYRDRPDKLKAWMVATQARISRCRSPEPPMLAGSDPPIHIPLLRGQDRLQRTILVGVIALLVFIPPLAFCLIQRIAS